MFRKLNKIKRITLTCPSCGEEQEEPALVISSFCKSCGEHFRVLKGKAIPNPGLRVSGLAEVRVDEEKGLEAPFVWNEPEETEEPPEDAWVISAEDKDRKAKPLPRPEEDFPEEAGGISAGAFFGLATEEEEPETAGTSSLGNQAQSKEALAEGSMAALIQSQSPAIHGDAEKMPPNYQPQEKRRRASDAATELEVRCFRCYHIQQVSRFAKSTQCERCSVYISLANYEIKTQKNHTLRTRGDIVIGRRGGLRKCEIACHHLTVNGVIDAFVDCSGDAVFRHSGVVRGNLYCRKLLIEKNCVVEFPDGVKAEKAEIQGQLEGDLTCSGQVRINRTGSVSGDVQAVEIDLKDGATISGQARIDPDTSTDLPMKVGFNPSVIG
ncbi:MAG: polymer-forming cytoskeletal protein [Verrucomicrobiales bacterium]|nr:polymer-forming cytoskeletal protein [Verrucomicrobiales bacterium]